MLFPILSNPADILGNNAIPKYNPEHKEISNCYHW